MVSAQAKAFSVTHIQRGKWDAKTGQHLSGYLTSLELDRLWCEVDSGNAQLWHVYGLNQGGNQHIATVVTRIEPMYDGTKDLVLIHGGGAWLKVIADIESYLFQEAKNQGCRALRAIVARQTIAKILKARFGFRDYEYLIAKEVQ